MLVLNDDDWASTAQGSMHEHGERRKYEHLDSLYCAIMSSVRKRENQGRKHWTEKHDKEWKSSINAFPHTQALPQSHGSTGSMRLTTCNTPKVAHAAAEIGRAAAG